MASMKTSRARKTRQASRSSLRLESLEPRLPLAGNVTAQFSGGTLLLTGDALGNEVVVASAPGGTMAVLGAPGTTINGSANPFVTTRAVTSIVANLNGGNDAIGFGNNALALSNALFFTNVPLSVSPADLQTAINLVAPGVTTFSLPGSLSVTTGDGNDAVGIVGNVGGSVVANLGSAITGPKNGNAFVLGDPLGGVTGRVGGAVSVVGGAQNDDVAINATNVGSGVTLALGNGENDTDVRGYGTTIGSFAYTGGTANDYVYLNNLTVRNSVSVFTGNQGEDEIGLYAPVTVGGSVILNTGTGADFDYLDLAGDIRGDLSVTTGAGNDEIYVSSSKIGLGLAINSGAGNDLIEFGSSTVGLNTVVNAGAGNDRVFSGNLTTRYNLFVYLGAGNDELTLNNAKAFAAFLYGGTGTNSLTTNAATRTGVRTLRSFQFQNTTN